MQTIDPALDVTGTKATQASQNPATDPVIEPWNPMGAFGFLATIAFALLALITPVALLLAGIWISIGGSAR